MRYCQKCGEKLKSRIEIDGKIHDVKKRKFCTNCVPIGYREIKTRICPNCNKEYKLTQIINEEIIHLHKRTYCINCSPLGTNHINKTYLLYEKDELNDIQKQIIVGHLLGDGCLEKDKKKKNAHLKIARKFTDWEYLKWTYDYFKNFVSSKGFSITQHYLKATNKKYNMVIFRTRASKIFTEYRSIWYPYGTKIIPEDIELTELIVAIWFNDDGCLYKNKKSNNFLLSFATDSFIYEDVKRLQEQLLIKLDFKSNITKHGKNYIISSGNTQNIRNLFTRILPVFPDLNRKLEQIKTFMETTTD